MVKSGTTNLSLRQGTKPAFGLWKIKVNHNMKSILAQKLYGGNI